MQDHRVVIHLGVTLPGHCGTRTSRTRPRRRPYRFHLLLTFVDYGAGGSREPVAELLRPGKTGSNTAVDHVAVLGAGISHGRQLPLHCQGRHGPCLPQSLLCGWTYRRSRSMTSCGRALGGCWPRCWCATSRSASAGSLKGRDEADRRLMVPSRAPDPPPHHPPDRFYFRDCTTPHEGHLRFGFASREAAEARWLAVNALHLVALVGAGALIPGRQARRKNRRQPHQLYHRLSGLEDSDSHVIIIRFIRRDQAQQGRGRQANGTCLQ